MLKIIASRCPQIACCREQYRRLWLCLFNEPLGANTKYSLDKEALDSLDYLPVHNLHSEALVHYVDCDEPSAMRMRPTLMNLQSQNHFLISFLGLMNSSFKL